MQTFFLVSIIIFVSLQNVIKKEYNKKIKNGTYLFSMICCFTVMMFFLYCTEGLEFSSEIIPYSIGFGVAYLSAVVFGVKAIGCGLLSLTALINSFSLMVPTLYGLIFLKESASLFLIIGIMLLAISLILINKKSSQGTITTKWILYVFLSFAGNGMCSVFQRMQQIQFGGGYKSEFMIFSLIPVVIITFFLFLKKERKGSATNIKKAGHLPVLCGIMNGGMNFFVMLISNKIPASVMFPTMSAGGIVLTFILSVFVYKERLSKKQLIGFMFGTLSVIFLGV